MSTKVRVLIWLCAVSLLVGCASTQVIALADGNYMVHATSASESYAMKGAVSEGEKYCAAMGKRFAMIDHTAKYQGMDKTAKGVLGAVSVLTNPNQQNAGYGYGSRHSMDSAEDYKVEMNFACK